MSRAISLRSQQISVTFCRKRNPSNGPKVLHLCNIAGKLLGESLLYSRAAQNEMILVSFAANTKITFSLKCFTAFQLVQLLVCDWLLESRTTCWEMEQQTDATNDDNNSYILYNPVSSHVLEKFQTDLNSLNCVIDQIPVSKLRNAMPNRFRSHLNDIHISDCQITSVFVRGDLPFDGWRRTRSHTRTVGSQCTRTGQTKSVDVPLWRQQQCQWKHHQWHHQRQQWEH